MSPLAGGRGERGFPPHPCAAPICLQPSEGRAGCPAQAAGPNAGLTWKPPRGHTRACLPEQMGARGPGESTREISHYADAGTMHHTATK